MSLKHKITLFNRSIIPLDELDLSSLNLRFVKASKIKSVLESEYRPLFEKYLIDSILYHINEVKRHGPDHHLFILMPLDFLQPVKTDVWLLYSFLLVVFPSDFRLETIQDIYLRAGEKTFSEGGAYSYSFYPKKKYEEYYLSFETHKWELFLNFFEEYRTMKRPQHFDVCFQSYFSHFHQYENQMSFLHLCIALESLVDGKEVVYRLRRNCAVINGKSVEKSDSIFKNLGRVYDLRSSIVHGDVPKHHLIENYTDYLRNLVSDTLIELIIINEESKQNLNEKITQIGFGENFKLCEDYNSKIAFSDAFCKVTGHEKLPK